MNQKRKRKKKSVLSRKKLLFKRTVTLAKLSLVEVPLSPHISFFRCGIDAVGSKNVSEICTSYVKAFSVCVCVYIFLFFFFCVKRNNNSKRKKSEGRQVSQMFDYSVTKSSILKNFVWPSHFLLCTARVAHRFDCVDLICFGSMPCAKSRLERLWFVCLCLFPWDWVLGDWRLHRKWMPLLRVGCWCVI